MRVIYKNTNVGGRKPDTSAMTHGEIAINYNANNPRIMTKDSNGEIASFLPESKIDSLFAAVNGQLSQAGIDAAFNTTDIENLNSWMGVPITEDEIEKLMSGNIYGTRIDKSNVVAGDLCCVNSMKKKIFIRPGGTASFNVTPIGVVVIPSSHDVYGTGECAIMSLNYMNCTTPDEGSISYQGIYWGDYNTDITGMTNFNKVPYIATRASAQTDTYSPTINGTSGYTYLPSDNFTGSTCGHDTSAKYYNTSAKSAPSPYLTDGSRNPLYYQTSSPSTTANTLSDFDGVGNTKVLTGLATGENWKTATSITNNSESTYYPAACCCWRYSTVGTVQGNWYLPACGELGYLCARLKTINNAIQYLIDSGFSDSRSLVAINYFWSSSESSSSNARLVSMYDGGVYNYGKNYNNYVRAFLRV